MGGTHSAAGAQPADDSYWDADDCEPDLTSWPELGYVRARFGGIPVLITPQLAADIRASRERRA
jgi:hypothetical protein